ncbi:MAG: hypothetical protein HKN33_18225 [Pyrinomonadaceae bacterium]|nr:hypothetical protein [Pyrinomonadaceae bacterium]
MKPGFISVPFKADTGDGLYESNGIGKFSTAGIVIEYESKLLGLFGSKVKEVRIGLNDIVNITFKKGLFKYFSRIHIRLNNVTKLSELPNSSGKVKLKLKREDFEHGQRAVELIQSLLEGKPIGDLPPTQSPVSELIGSSEDKYKTNDLNKTRKLDD